MQYGDEDEDDGTATGPGAARKPSTAMIQSDEPPLFPAPQPTAAPPLPSKGSAANTGRSAGSTSNDTQGQTGNVETKDIDEAVEEPLAMVEESELGLVIARELKNTYAPLEMWYLRSTIEKVSVFGCPHLHPLSLPLTPH